MTQSQRFSSPGARIWLTLFLTLFAALSQITSAQDGEIRVINQCPFPIWSHGYALSPGANLHDGVPEKLEQGDSVIYADIPLPIQGGRIYGYYKEPPAGATSLTSPVSQYNQFIEYTIDDGTNINVSYVDRASLPVSVEHFGDGVSCTPTASLMHSTDWFDHLDSCPTQLNYFNPDIGIGTCQSSYNFCEIPSNENLPYCTKMEAAYGEQLRDLLYEDCLNFQGLPEGQCADLREKVTVDSKSIYGGVFLYNGSNWQVPAENVLFWDWIAAFNRGTVAAEPDSAEYYLGPEFENGEWVKPYNEFAKWVHRDIPAEIYAFSTDDHQDHSGFQRCVGGTDIVVTWCPVDNICDLTITNVSQTDVDCFGQATGALSITAIDGIEPVAYSIDGGNTWQSSPNFINLEAGTYEVEARGGGSCFDNTEVVITQPGATAYISGTNTVCDDDNSTTPITVDLTGSAPWDLVYSIDGNEQPPITGISASPYVFQSLPGAHTYELISVSDADAANNCSGGTVSGIAEITVATPIETTNVGYCEPGTVSFKITDNGGVYEWYNSASGGAAFHTGTSYSADVVNNEGITFYVKDANQEAYGAEIQGFTDESITGTGHIRYNQTANSLNFTALGDATLNQVTAKFDEYGLGLTSINAVLTDLADNSTQEMSLERYSEDLNESVYHDIPLGFELEEGHNYNLSIVCDPGVGLMEFLSYPDFNQYPQNIGRINITGSNLGDGFYPAIFSWDLTWGTPGGECRTAVRAYYDAQNCGCEAVAPEMDDIVICERDTAILDAGSYSVYAWSNGATARQIEVHQAGNYSVTVEDFDECVAMGQVDVEIRSKAEVSVQAVESAYCYGYDLAFAIECSHPDLEELTASITIDQQTFEEFDVQIGLDTLYLTPSYSIYPTATSLFTLSFTDTLGCDHTPIGGNQLAIEILGTPSVLAEDLVICGEEDAKDLEFTLLGDSLYTLWMNINNVDTILQDVSGPTLTFGLAGEGVYRIDSLVGDNGCPEYPRSETTVTVNQAEFSPADIEYIAYPTCDGIWVQPSTQALAEIYSWMLNGETFSALQLPDPIELQSGDTAQISLQISTTSGCEDESDLRSEDIILTGSEIIIPNVFSPGNGDGVNDVLTLDPNDWYDGCIEFRVFNRWGEIVFDNSTDLNLDYWDGVSKTGELAPEGTYFYVFSVGSQEPEGSSVTLVR